MLVPPHLVPNALHFIFLTMNDFLIITTEDQLIYWLFKKLSIKCPEHVENLGPPTQYLGWNIEYKQKIAIKISQPN